MKYIKKLEKQNENLKEQVNVLLEGINHIQDYVSSNKFTVNEYVNVKDIVLRIHEIKSNHWSIEVNY